MSKTLFKAILEDELWCELRILTTYDWNIIISDTFPFYETIKLWKHFWNLTVLSMSRLVIIHKLETHTRCSYKSYFLLGMEIHVSNVPRKQRQSKVGVESFPTHHRAPHKSSEPSRSNTMKSDVGGCLHRAGSSPRGEFHVSIVLLKKYFWKVDA